jgi:signal transduction histidine kinase
VTWTTLPAFDSQTRSGTGLFVLLGGLLFTALFVLFLMTLMLRDQTVEQWLVHERRMVIPTIIFITITAFMFGLYSLLKQRELSNIQNIVYEKSNKINKLIFHEVKDRLLSIDRMASRWVAADGTSYPQWRNDAANHLRDQMGLTSLEVLNSQLVTQWIEPTDVNGSEIGTALAVNPRQIQLLTDAKEAHHLALLIEPTKDNQQAIMQEFVPLYAKNVFDGFMVGEFDLHALFGNILDPELADDFSVTILSKGQILFKQTPEKTTLVEALTTYSTMRLYDQTWQIRLTPTEHWVNNQLSNLPNVILMSGLLISVLLALTVRAVLLARLKSRDLLTSEEKLRLSNIKLQQSVEQLASSNLELERFAHVASHDMQEPLRMISGFSDLVLKDYADKLDGEGKTYLTMIYDGSERMRVMIRDLLDYSRINREKVEKVCVCGETALKLALDNLSQLISETHAQISHDPIPDFSGNPIQIMRLLQNLIANAIKYQQIGQTPHVHVSVQQKADELLFSVQDNGIGVEPSFIETVFEPFRRLHHWDRIKGSGMGLAVCRKIVENHGGKIWMTSTPGEGTQVWFSISLVEGAK